jgi:hypothetical protein
MFFSVHLEQGRIPVKPGSHLIIRQRHGWHFLISTVTTSSVKIVSINAGYRYLSVSCADHAQP